MGVEDKSILEFNLSMSVSKIVAIDHFVSCLPIILCLVSQWFCHVSYSRLLSEISDIISYIRSCHPWWGYSKGIIRLRIAAYDFLISRGSTQTNNVDLGWLVKYFWAEKYFNTAVFSNYDKISHPQSRPINHTLAMQ